MKNWKNWILFWISLWLYIVNWINKYSQWQEKSFWKRFLYNDYNKSFVTINIKKNTEWYYIEYMNWEKSIYFDSYYPTPPWWNDRTNSPIYVMKDWLYNLVWIDGKLIGDNFFPYKYETKRCIKWGDESIREYTVYLSDKYVK